MFSEVRSIHNNFSSLHEQPRWNYMTPSNERMDRFKQLVKRYEINKDYATCLGGLEAFEIVFIVDDSGSMNTPIGAVTSPFDAKETRWDEVKRIVSIVVDVAAALDPDGVDVYFLNRAPILHVRDSSELQPIFAVLPEGPTPIAQVLRQVLREKEIQIQERKLLVLIAIDGEPTDNDGRVDIQNLEQVLRKERNPIAHIPVTFIACTDDDYSIGYLNTWDETIDYVDVVDDYRTEKKQILRIQGPTFPFSFGDYIVKILLGSINEWFDELDERKVDVRGPSRFEASAQVPARGEFLTYKQLQQDSNEPLLAQNVGNTTMDQTTPDKVIMAEKDATLNQLMLVPTGSSFQIVCLDLRSEIGATNIKKEFEELGAFVYFHSEHQLLEFLHLNDITYTFMILIGNTYDTDNLNRLKVFYMRKTKNIYVLLSSDIPSQIVDLRFRLGNDIACHLTEKGHKLSSSTCVRKQIYQDQSKIYRTLINSIDYLINGVKSV
ncbi:unnamed protein product [Didymodactylos carnosus]|uniref:VWFA domain-containing protein n=2 Tax=Didymodactylos carnosus TaxID=1234261 RepID=A0A815CHC8_9BILA|nr:unnamed protein product [Didymodactylos carnosus]CAF4089639.1 unnamed protein product [Didymodactylos carnosus]